MPNSAVSLGNVRGYGGDVICLFCEGEQEIYQLAAIVPKVVVRKAWT